MSEEQKKQARESMRIFPSCPALALILITLTGRLLLLKLHLRQIPPNNQSLINPLLKPSVQSHTTFLRPLSTPVLVMMSCLLTLPTIPSFFILMAIVRLDIFLLLLIVLTAIMVNCS